MSTKQQVSGSGSREGFEALEKWDLQGIGICLALFSPPVLSVPAEQQMDGALRRGRAERHQAPWNCPNTHPRTTPRPSGASPPGPGPQQVQCLALQALVPSLLQAVYLLLPFALGWTVSARKCQQGNSPKPQHMEEHALPLLSSSHLLSTHSLSPGCNGDFTWNRIQGVDWGTRGTGPVSTLCPCCQPVQTRQQMKPSNFLLRLHSFVAPSN